MKLLPISLSGEYDTKAQLEVREYHPKGFGQWMVYLKYYAILPIVITDAQYHRTVVLGTTKIS